MVLQGGAAPQVALSIPVEGLTVTAAEADTMQAQPRIEAHTSAAARQYAARGERKSAVYGQRVHFWVARGSLTSDYMR